MGRLATRFSYPPLHTGRYRHPNWDWFWRDVLCLWRMDLGVGDKIIEPILGQHLDKTGSALQPAVGRIGRCVDFTGATLNYYQTPGNSQIFQDSLTTGSLTGICLLEANGWTSNVGMLGFGWSGAWRDRWGAMWTGTVTNEIGWFHYDNNGFQGVQNVDAAAYDGTPTLVFGISDLGLNDISSWYGKPGQGLTKKTSTTPAILSGPADVPALPLIIGDYDNVDHNNPFNGKIYYVAIMDGVIAEVHARQLLQNPFGPFERIRKPTYMVPVAAAAGGIRNPMGGPTILRNPLGMQ